VSTDPIGNISTDANSTRGAADLDPRHVSSAVLDVMHILHRSAGAGSGFLAVS
jgi:hypothetical protein